MTLPLRRVTSERIDSDVVVVGAGTAGANVAGQLARRGLVVTIVERRSFDRAGPHWHNGVPPWQFDRARVARPEAPEKTADGGRLHLFAPDGTHAVSVDNPVWPVDMALLGARLRRDARHAGTRVIDQAEAIDLEIVDGRCVAMSVTGSLEGEPLRRHHLAARLFVDASGRRGAIRRRVPDLAPWCPQVTGPELCSAGDHQLDVADQTGARRFLERHGAEPGDGVTVVGCDGGFSTRAIRVSADLTQVSVLVGCLADGHASSAPRMIADARAAEPWLGPSRVSGTGVIPLRRPYARFTAGGVALVGDAACQVFPGHGSGIGVGMIAGTMLAETVEGATDPGDPSVLWRYQERFWKDFGGLCASYDAVRRMSTALGSTGVTEMIHAGLLNPTLTRGGLDQREVSPAPSDLPAMVGALARRPGLAARVVPWLARSRAASLMARRYPSVADVDALRRWDHTMHRIVNG